MARPDERQSDWIEYLPVGRQGSFLNFRCRFDSCRDHQITSFKKHPHNLSNAKWLKYTYQRIYYVINIRRFIYSWSSLL